MTDYTTEDKYNSLLKSAINDGNVDSYNDIVNMMFLYNDLAEAYYYSQIMAFKYNCAEAYYNLYRVLSNKGTINDINTYSDDEYTNNMAKYYLLKSYELGYKDSKSILKTFFKENKIPSSFEYINFQKLNNLTTK